MNMIELGLYDDLELIDDVRFLMFEKLDKHR
jgi:hypothetical protein